MRLVKTLAITTALMATSTAVQAQNAPHGIAAVVNSDIVTIHDLRQRVLFMMATTGAETDEASIQRLQRQALRNLVDEHLQMQEAEKYEQSISDEEVNASVARLLSRNGADPNALVAAKGGDVGWVREGELRPEIDNVIKQMEPGSLSTPIQVPGGVYVVALVEKKTSESDTLYKLKQVTVEAETEAAKARLISLRGELTSCDTLENDVDAFEDVAAADMGEIKSSDLNDEIVTALANTEVGGLSDPFERPDGATSIMVCERRATGSDVPTRDQIEDRLLDQQLAQASKRALRDLRRQATLVVR